MNSEDKIYSKIKNASHKGEKNFPAMDKVWNRVEEKLDNTIVVQKKNTWQKLAIAATVLLSFSIIYQFVGNEETFKDKIKNNETNSVIVSNDSALQIIEKVKEVVVITDISKKQNSKTEKLKIKTNPSENSIVDAPIKTEINSNAITNFVPNVLNNNLSNSANSNMDYLLKGRNFESKSANYDWYVEKPAETKEAKLAAPVMKIKDLVIIDGVAMDKHFNADKELAKLNLEDYNTSVLPNPLYIINGVEYSEESLFGKNPSSPYAPLSQQKITSTSILEPINATKIYGKKGEKGIIIITTKDGKSEKK